MKPFLFLFLLLLIGVAGNSQDTIAKKNSFSEKKLPELLEGVNKKAIAAEVSIDKATNTYLSKLLKQENKLKSKLLKKDSILAKQLFNGVEQKYSAFKDAPQKLSNAASVYSGHLDSLSTALNFLKGSNISVNPELQKTLSQFSSLQDKLNSAEGVKMFIAERRKLLKEQLEKIGMLKELKGFQKQAYYYSAQLQEYKAVWEDPAKLEKKLMEIVMKLPQFKDFFAKNSMLSSLFALPGGSSGSSLAGLQTRASIQQSIIQRFGSGPNVQQMLQQNMQAAQGQLNELKNKLSQYGSGSYGNSGGDIDLPKGFKPNSQKTKTFLQRLEYGANIQSQKARSFFPVTSDLGLSLGYKLNDKSSIGVGATYKLGLGRGWNNIRLSHEGLGLRSYVDYKLKGTLYMSGGYEQNYRTAFSSVQQLQDYSSWQTNGLLGLSKKYKVSKKVKGEMKLLWDFMSTQQVPRTQMILFRIGYNLK